MRLSQLLSPDAIDLNLQGTNRNEVLASIVDHIIRIHPELKKRRDNIYEKLLERERMEPTALSNGAAIPHCKINEIQQPIVTLGRTPEPVDFGARDGKPTRLFFTVLSPNEHPALHLKVLAAVARILKENKHVEALLKAPDEETVIDLIRQWDLES